MNELINKFKGKKILVIGDIGLDRFRVVERVHGSAREDSNLSILRYVHGKDGHVHEYSPGAGGNLAWNFASLGAEVYVLGVIGEDHHGDILKKELVKRNIKHDLLISSNKRTTITFEKTFEISDLSSPIQRWDEENETSIGYEIEEKIIEIIDNAQNKFDLVVAIDHCEMDRSTTIITDNILKSLANLKGKVKTFGTSRNYIGKFDNFYALVINDNELVRGAGSYVVNNFTEIVPLDKVRKALPIFYNKSNCDFLIVTLGDRGALLYDSHGEIYISTIPLVGDIDTCGCGDTFLATLSLAELSGMNKNDSIDLANKVAGITGKKIGVTGVPNIDDIS